MHTDHLPMLNQKSKLPRDSLKISPKSLSPLHSLRSSYMISASKSRKSQLRKSPLELTLKKSRYSHDIVKIPSSIKSRSGSTRILQSDLSKRKVRASQLVVTDSRYTEVINSLFKISNCSQEIIPALSILKLLISLECTSDVKGLVQVLREIGGIHDIKSILFTRSELILLCEDVRVERMLQSLNHDFYTNLHKPGDHKFDGLIRVIKGWWKKIKKPKTKKASMEDACNFLLNNRVVESIQDALRLLFKFQPVLTFSQFLGVHCKALFKFLLSEVLDLRASENLKSMSPDIAINAQRRKILVDAVQGNNNVLQSLHDCKLYNN